MLDVSRGAVQDEQVPGPQPVAADDDRPGVPVGRQGQGKDAAALLAVDRDGMAVPILQKRWIGNAVPGDPARALAEERGRTSTLRGLR